ncbi:B12-binding domain-containing protein [Streptomyces sp. NPDC053750]|uniref:B12-binding domain-containing protein n=1 Tax=Streptomyces sp. NPDC053750 TaxID=3365714 RepID=UPI0037CFFEA5
MTDRTTTCGGAGSLLEKAREELWLAVRARDEGTAEQVVFGALDAGVGAEDVLLDIIVPVQRRVGAEWAAARFSVAQEHAATAIHERIIAAMARRAPVAEPHGTPVTVTVACVDGEWHALPARLLAEVLRQRGYGVDFLGSQVPTPNLIAHLHRTTPDALALSSSIPTRLPNAHAAVTAARAIGVPVLVGGAAFGADGRHARRLGADAWAPDARAAAAVLDRGLPRPAATAVRESHEDLPHLADQEYTLVSRNKRRLVRAILDGLELRLPDMRGYTETQRERTAEDLAHIVDFLATALYTDDLSVFTDFLDWTGKILEARGVPARSVDPGLALLQDELKDFPRALAVLARGRAALAGSRQEPEGLRSGGPTRVPER